MLLFLNPHKSLINLHFPSQHALLGPIWDEGRLTMWAPSGIVRGHKTGPTWVAHVESGGFHLGPGWAPPRQIHKGIKVGPTWDSPCVNQAVSTWALGGPHLGKFKWDPGGYHFG